MPSRVCAGRITSIEYIVLLAHCHMFVDHSAIKILLFRLSASSANHTASPARAWHALSMRVVSMCDAMLRYYTACQPLT
jgi:hypothetical protein